MMVSAVTIDGLDKIKQKEHLFNDVKYATISLNKDIKLIEEEFEQRIFSLDIEPVKSRLQGEYNELLKPTYGFLQLENFSLERYSLMQYFKQLQEVYEQCKNKLEFVAKNIRHFSDFGLKKLWNYEGVLELALLFESIDSMVIPTRYWFDPKKYDFMQELMDETQTKVEEYLTAMKRIKQSWSERILEPEQVGVLDYYIERKEAGLKLFDLNFHKCKKVLKELFTDEYRTFQDSEIEELHKNVYIVKRNEYWLSRNHSRIKQFLGETYQDTETEFTLLRTQYAIYYKISSEYTELDTYPQLAKTMMEEASYQNLTQMLQQMKQSLEEMPYESLIGQLPCVQDEVMGTNLFEVEQTVHRFYEMLIHLLKDYEVFQEYRHPHCKSHEFGLEYMRKVIYCLERVEQKQDWLKKNRGKIKEIFRNEEPNLDTDWNTIKEKLFYTDRKDSFPKYQTVDKTQFLQDFCGQVTLLNTLQYVLKVEGPIKEEILYKRIVELMDLVRITPKMKQEIELLLSTELVEEYYIEEGFVYSKANEKLTLRLPSQEEEKREISLIAPKELKQGILALLELEYEMTMDEIGKELSGLLGYPRRTKKFNDFIEQAVRELQREEMIQRYSGGFRIENH